MNDDDRYITLIEKIIRPHFIALMNKLDRNDRFEGWRMAFIASDYLNSQMSAGNIYSAQQGRAILDHELNRRWSPTDLPGLALDHNDLLGGASVALGVTSLLIGGPSTPQGLLLGGASAALGATALIGKLFSDSHSERELWLERNTHKEYDITPYLENGLSNLSNEQKNIAIAKLASEAIYLEDLIQDLKEQLKNPFVYEEIYDQWGHVETYVARDISGVLKHQIEEAEKGLYNIFDLLRREKIIDENYLKDQLGNKYFSDRNIYPFENDMPNTMASPNRAYRHGLPEDQASFFWGGPMSAESISPESWAYAEKWTLDLHNLNSESSKVIDNQTIINSLLADSATTADQSTEAIITMTAAQYWQQQNDALAEYVEELLHHNEVIKVTQADWNALKVKVEDFESPDLIDEEDWAEAEEQLQKLRNSTKKTIPLAQQLAAEFTSVGHSLSNLSIIASSLNLPGAELFGITGSGALNIAAGLNNWNFLDTKDNVSFLDYAAVGSQIATSLLSTFDNLFGRFGLFGSARYDNAHVSGWMGGLGVNDQSVITQGQQLPQQYRDQGYDKFQARTIAEMNMIPAMINSLGKLDQGQFDQMLWKVSHGVETLGYGFDAWREALPSIGALMDQVGAKNVKWTDHLSAMVSGLSRMGLVTEDIFAVASEYAGDNKIRAYMNQMADGIREGNISLGDFSLQFAMFYAEAEERGMGINTQMEKIIIAAKDAGWSLTDVEASFQGLLDSYKDQILALRDQTDAIADQIHSVNAQLQDMRWQNYKFNQFTLPQAKDSLWQNLIGNRKEIEDKLAAEKNPARKKELQERLDEIPEFQFQAFTYKERQHRGSGEHDRHGRKYKGEKYTGGEAWDKLLDQISYLTKDGRLTTREMMDTVKAVNPEARQDVAAYLETVKQGLQMDAQITALKEQKKQLRENKREIKNKIVSVREKLSSIRQLLSNAKKHWKETAKATRKMARNSGGSKNDQDPQVALGGVIYGRQRYLVGEIGPEYVMSNHALNVYGEKFMNAVNSGTYTTPVVPVPVTTTAPAAPMNLNVTASVKGNNKIVIEHAINDRDLKKAITYELVDKRIVPLLKERDRLTTI